MRSTIGKERLSSLSLLHTESNITEALNTDHIIDTYDTTPKCVAVIYYSRWLSHQQKTKSHIVHVLSVELLK